MEESDWTLERIRAEIDRVDAKLLRLLQRRAELALQAKREKERLGLSVEDPEREKEVIARAVRSSSGPLPPDEVRKLFSVIVASCRRVQVATRSSGMEANEW